MTRLELMAQFAQKHGGSIDSSKITGTKHSPTEDTSYLKATRGTTLWKVLLLLVLMLVVSFGLAIGSIRLLHGERHEVVNFHKVGAANTTLPSLNKPLVFNVSEILHSIDASVDPCYNFYAYSCNQWIKDNPIPDDKSKGGMIDKLERQNQLVLRNILERPEEEFKSVAEKKAKMYYQSCLDEDKTIEKLGAEPLLKLLRSIGGWNVTASGFNVKKWSLKKLLKILQSKYNVGGLFTWAVKKGNENPTNYIIKIEQGDMTMRPRDFFSRMWENEKQKKAYLDYMTTVSVLLGADEANARKQMTNVIGFETVLAMLALPQSYISRQTTSIEELQKLAPFIDWFDHFNEAFQLAERKITADEMVDYDSVFMRKLNIMITAFCSTDEDKSILNNYLVWQIVRTLTPYLSKAFRDAYKDFRKVLDGADDGGQESWNRCVTDTTNVLGIPIGVMFVREVLHGESKSRAKEMIDGIQTAFKDNLNNTVWMDIDTRKLAIEKAGNVLNMLGLPDYILNPDDFVETYQDLNIDPKAYYENNININIYSLRKYLEKLDQPAAKSLWNKVPSIVDAYYTPSKNQIAFPERIFQLPFFGMQYPKSLHYGVMGAMVGHLLTHVFDDLGIHKQRWTGSSTMDAYNKLTKCFNNKYSSYEGNGKNVIGKQTMSEYIADNGGMKAAFNAYIKNEKLSVGDTKPLLGLNLTHRQLFFVSFAQVFCSTVTDETTTQQIEKDPHSPPMYRVIRSLTDSNEFSDTFECKWGSRMNPVRECMRWYWDY